MKNKLIHYLFALLPFSVMAQATPPDTVEIELGGTSKVIFITQDKNDLEHLKHYDFQALFEDIIDKLDTGSVKSYSKTDDIPASQDPTDEGVRSNRQTYSDDDFDDDEYDDDDYDDDDYDDDDFYDDDDDDRDRSYPTSRQFFNMDFGINNYLETGEFTDPNQSAYYAVHPWGSWNIALNAVNRVRFSDKFSLEAGLGVSWYNFKFDQDNSLITKTIDGVTFGPDPRDLDFTKSKLTVSYLNLSAIPVFNTGKVSYHHHWHSWKHSEFRVGLGPYIGYRLGSHSKLQNKEDGDKDNEKEHDNFYLQNLRYGLRLQIGVHGLDLFINYDLNELFIENKGPDLNAYSFGISF